MQYGGHRPHSQQGGSVRPASGNQRMMEDVVLDQEYGRRPAGGGGAAGSVAPLPGRLMYEEDLQARNRSVQRQPLWSVQPNLPGSGGASSFSSFGGGAFSSFGGEGMSSFGAGGAASSFGSGSRNPQHGLACSGESGQRRSPSGKRTQARGAVSATFGERGRTTTLAPGAVIRPRPPKYSGGTPAAPLLYPRLVGLPSATNTWDSRPISPPAPSSNQNAPPAFGGPPAPGLLISSRDRSRVAAANRPQRPPDLRAAGNGGAGSSAAIFHPIPQQQYALPVQQSEFPATFVAPLGTSSRQPPRPIMSTTGKKSLSPIRLMPGADVRHDHEGTGTRPAWSLSSHDVVKRSESGMVVVLHPERNGRSSGRPEDARRPGPPDTPNTDVVGQGPRPPRPGVGEQGMIPAHVDRSPAHYKRLVRKKSLRVRTEYDFFGSTNHWLSAVTNHPSHSIAQLGLLLGCARSDGRRPTATGILCRWATTKKRGQATLERDKGVKRARVPGHTPTPYVWLRAVISIAPPRTFF